MITKIQGKEVTELPKDLYIPPNAMVVILEIFEGPLDLLLYLIRKHNLDIIDISVAAITKQYLDYVEYLQCSNLELAGDYLEMAAILTEIKSRLLLPVLTVESENETDPRAELVRRLQEYEQIRQAAINLDLLPRQERDFFVIEFNNLFPAKDIHIIKPEVKFNEVLFALIDVLKRQELREPHIIIAGENLSVRDKMTIIFTTLQSLQEISNINSTVMSKPILFSDLFNSKEGKLGIVVNFLAILELVKENLLEVIQAEPFAPIYLKLK